MVGFGYVVVASGLNEPTAVARAVGAPLDAVVAAGGRAWTAADLHRPEPLVIVVGTGGSEHEVLRTWSARRAAGVGAGRAALLVTHPAHNSLPAGLEALARMHQDGDRGRIVHLGGRDPAGDREAVATAVADLQAWADLSAVRLGVVGEPSDWLVASTPDPAVVTARWGPTVVPVPIDALIARVQDVGWRSVKSLAADVLVGAAGLHEPEPPAIVDAARVYRALSDLADAESLDAVTVRCFDLITRVHTSGCVALAQLNDERVVAGCEGDVVSTIGMIWVERLLDEVPWMANPADLDPGAGTVTLAHCTIARSIVESYRLRTHFESGEGVGIEGRYPLGPVTLLRIGGRDLDRLWLAEGEVVERGHDGDRCRTQIDVRVDAGGTVDDLLTAPLGNHLVVARGHHARRLRSWWDLYVAGR